MRTLLVFMLTVWALVAGSEVSSAQEPARLALLIGNKGYTPKVGPLKNPHNDVELIGAALTRVGFKVTVIKDADLKKFNVGFQAYLRELKRAGADAISFFYYSGHGVVDADTNENYLLPVDISQVEDERLWSESVKQRLIIDQLAGEAPAATHYVIFDSCRTELIVSGPVAKSLGSTKGFVPMAPRTKGMLIAYSTAPNRVARDDGEGSGPYAKALAEELIRVGIDSESVFNNVGRRVRTKINQDPWKSASTMPLIYFAGEPPTDTALAARQKAAGADWERLKTSRDLSELLAFAKKYNGLREAEEALDRIANLKPGEVATERGTSEVTAGSGSSTGGGQGWWQRAYASLREMLPKKQPASTAPPVPAAPQLPPVSNEERHDWQRALFVDTAEAYRQFIAAWPNSRYLKEANASLAEREKKREPTTEDIESSVAKAAALVRSKRVDITKTAIVLGSSDDKAEQKAIDSCLGNRKYNAVLTGIVQAHGFMALGLQALEGEDLPTADENNLLNGGNNVPRGLLGSIGPTKLPQLMTRLRSQVPPALMASKDIRATAQELLRYKTKFDKRITEENFKSISYAQETADILGDDKADDTCYDRYVEVYLGVDDVPNSSENSDKDVAAYRYFSLKLHQYLYGFWYRRRLEGTSDLTAVVLKRIASE